MKVNSIIGIKEEQKYEIKFYVDRVKQIWNLKKEHVLIVVQQHIKVKIVVKDQDKQELNLQIKIFNQMMF